MYDKACFVIDKNSHYKFKFSKVDRKDLINNNKNEYLPEYSVIDENLSELNLLHSFNSKIKNNLSISQGPHQQATCV